MKDYDIFEYALQKREYIARQIAFMDKFIDMLKSIEGEIAQEPAQDKTDKSGEKAS